MLDESLRSILVCPQDKQPLWFIADEGVLYNERIGCTYAVKDSIPSMLQDNAQPTDDEMVRRFTNAIETGRAVRTGSKEAGK